MFGLRTRFAGHGVLAFQQTDETLQGAFSVHVSPNSSETLLLGLDQDYPVEMLLEGIYDGATFTGLTADGSTVRADHVSLFDGRLHTVGQLTVGDMGPSKSIRVYLPNVVGANVSFGFPAPLHDVSGQMTFRKDAKDLRPPKAASKSVQLTAVLDLSTPRGLVSWDSLEEPVSRVTSLLSLATGRYIRWLAVRGTGVAGKDWWLYRNHSLGAWYGKRELVPLTNPKAFQRLLTSGTSSIGEMDRRKRVAFDNALGLYLASGPSYVFPQPLYQLAGALEALADAFVQNERYSYISQWADKPALRQSFDEWVRANLLPVSGDLQDELLSQMSNKFDSLVGRTLMGRVDCLAATFGIPLDASTLRPFKKLRDLSTHGQFHRAPSSLEQYASLKPAEALIRKVLLKIIDYQGLYYAEENGWQTAAFL